MAVARSRDDLVLKSEPPRDRHPVARYLDGLAPGSRRTLRQALDRIAGMISGGRANADTFAWHKLTRRDASALRANLLRVYSAATTNKMLSAFRGVLRESCGLGYIAEADLRKLADMPSVRNDRLATGRTLADPEVRALFAACKKGGGPASCRDAALLALLYGAGMRRSEVVALDLSDYERGSGMLKVRGRAERVLAEGGARAAIDAWLAQRGRERGALLCPVDKAGRVRLRHMTDQAVLYIVRRRAELAGIRRFSPHDLRRSFFFRMRRGRKVMPAPRSRPDVSVEPVPTLPVPFRGC